MARRATALLTTTLTLLLTVVLAACQSDPGTAAGSEESAAADPSTVIETKFGPVTPPAEPQRVVALGWGDAETALALGVQPVGAADWLAFGGEGVGPWAEGIYDAEPKILGTLELSYEEVAALNPDLILDVKSSGDQDRYDKLSEIAPTVGIPEGGDSYTTGMDRQVTMIGQALGVQDKAEQLLAEVDAQFTTAAAEFPQFEGKTVTAAAFSGNGWGAYIGETDRVQFLQRLGMQNNPAVDAAEPDGFSVPISDESLDLMDADLLVVSPIGTTKDEIEQNKLFRQVPAVQDGRYVILDDPDISKAYSTNSTLSIGYALDKVPSLMAEALG
jgi:iron complex transport system substrate-binding protein